MQSPLAQLKRNTSISTTFLLHLSTILFSFFLLFQNAITTEQVSDINLITLFRRTKLVEQDDSISYDALLHKIVGFSNPKSHSAIMKSAHLVDCRGVHAHQSVWAQLCRQVVGRLLDLLILKLLFARRWHDPILSTNV